MFPCIISVSWSVIFCQDGCLTAFATGALPEEYLKVKMLMSTASEDTRLFWCLSYPSGGALWALCFLLFREIDRGNWLARGCMPAHQHCNLFYPLGWGSAWVCRKLSNALILRSRTGSWVLSD